MSMYRFRGGPWHGFVIEYADLAQPDGAVHPATRSAPPRGFYTLNAERTTYEWTATGPRTGA